MWCEVWGPRPLHPRPWTWLSQRRCPVCTPCRIQRDYFRKQEEAGLIHPKPPTPPTQHKTLLETVGVPSYVHATEQDPIQAMNTSISKHMWTSNPGEPHAMHRINRAALSI